MSVGERETDHEASKSSSVQAIELIEVNTLPFTSGDNFHVALVYTLCWLRETSVRKNGYFGRTCNNSSTLVVSARTSYLHLQYRYKTTHLQHDRLTQVVRLASLA